MNGAEQTSTSKRYIVNLPVTPESLRAQARVLLQQADELEHQNRLQRLAEGTIEYEIVGTAADYYHVSVLDIVSKRRTAHIAAARQLAVYLLHEERKLSFPVIGALIGRDHSTAIHARNKVQQSFSKRPTFEIQVRKLRQQIQSRQNGAATQAA